MNLAGHAMDSFLWLAGTNVGGGAGEGANVVQSWFECLTKTRKTQGLLPSQP